MEAARAYHDAIDALVAMVGATHATMHVHVGLAIFVLTGLWRRDRRGGVATLNVVLAAELGNEVMDRLACGSWNWPDTLADIALTMAWPVLLTLASRYRRRRWRREEQALGLLAQVARTARRRDTPGLANAAVTNHNSSQP